MFADKVLQEKLALQEEIVLQKTVAFRTLFEAFEGGAATLDDQGHITGNNRALEARLGYELGELCHCSFLNLIHPQDTEAVHSFLHSLLGVKSSPESAPHFSKELRFYSKTGAILWGHLSLSVLHDADLKAQQHSLVLALLDDVTRRRQAEGVAARLSTGVNDLYRVISDQQSDEFSQMKALLALGCRLFDVQTGLISKIKEQQLEIMAAISPDSRLRVGQVYEMGGDAAKRMELPSALRNGPIRRWQERPFIAVTEHETFLGSPIYVGGHLTGLLCFADAAPREMPFDAEQTQFCQLMALWIGSEIERRHRNSQREKEAADLVQNNAKLEALATQDGLTGVKNRRAFDERLQTEIKRALRSSSPLSLLLLDVDKFKHFNDNFGHPAGDEVLKKVARLLQDGVREEGMVARYGGEEFVVVLPNTAIDKALVIAERLRSRLETATWTHRSVTASFGAASWTAGMTTPAQLISTADGALYQSKEGGRNRVSAGTFTG